VNSIYKNFFSDTEWPEEKLKIPSSPSWLRTNEVPIVGEVRYVLGHKDMIGKEMCWVLFQPGNSSVNKSFIDFPEEMNDTFLVKIKVIESYGNKIRYDDRFYNFTLNTWFYSEVLETVKLRDIPKGPLIEVKSLPDYESNESVGITEFDDFFVVEADDQSYAGKKSLYLKERNHTYLTLHEEYIADDHSYFLYNHRLSEEEMKQLDKFRN